MKCAVPFVNHFQVLSDENPQRKYVWNGMAQPLICRHSNKEQKLLRIVCVPAPMNRISICRRWRS